MANYRDDSPPEILTDAILDRMPGKMKYRGLSANGDMALYECEDDGNLYLYPIKVQRKKADAKIPKKQTQDFLKEYKALSNSDEKLLDQTTNIFGELFTRILIGLLCAVFAFTIIIMTVSIFGVPLSTVDREIADTGLAYNSDCIDDELGWIGNVPDTAAKLQEFYDKTGVQPYIYLKEYDSSLVSDDQKVAFTEKWYRENIGNEGAFLYIYFANRDAENGRGAMTTHTGDLVSSVMDSQATDIFWAYLDQHWYSDLNFDETVVAIFNDTADRIMDKTIDVLRVFLLLGGVAVGLCVLAFAGSFVYFIFKNKAVQEENDRKRVELILNTPLEVLIENNDLIRKFDSEDHPQ